MSSPDESMKLTMIVLGGEPVRHLALSDKLDAQAAMPYLTCLVTPPLYQYKLLIQLDIISLYVLYHQSTHH